MKKLLVFLVLLSVFLFLLVFFRKTLLNKLNISFESKPGSCLILEQKNCDKGEIVYSENKEILGIRYKLSNNTKIFSPVSGEYSRNLVTGKNGEKHEIGTLTFKYVDSMSVDLDKRQWYEFTFKNINKTVTKGTLDINKGSILNTINTTNQNDYDFFVTVKRNEKNGIETKNIIDVDEINRLTNPK